MTPTIIYPLAIMELWTLLWCQNDSFILLTLNKADTIYFSYNMIT